MTNTHRLKRLATDWLQAPPNWVPLAESERKALRQRLEDMKQRDDGKESES